MEENTVKLDEVPILVAWLMRASVDEIRWWVTLLLLTPDGVLLRFRRCATALTLGLHSG